MQKVEIGPKDTKKARKSSLTTPSKQINNSVFARNQNKCQRFYSEIFGNMKNEGIRACENVKYSEF